MSKLHVIFDSRNESGNTPELDIVCVHGLNFANKTGHAMGTWTRDNKLWPRDFLPARLEPSPVRVMLFEYNSSPAMGASAIKLDDHARSLLQLLSQRRKEVKSRPLVFICHSLGGLLVKEALVEGTLDSTFNSLVDATCLLVFFATPHQGGKHATVGDIAAKLVRPNLGKPRNDFLEALKATSNEAARRFKQSRYLLDKILVTSFYETKSYGKLGLIVEKKSAILDLPPSQQRQVRTEDDHSSICKFSSADDPACELALRVIAEDIQRGIKLKASVREELSKNIHWGISWNTNSLFTGRSEILNRIESAITLPNSRQTQKRFVITGPGGLGKTEICLKVAYQLQHRFWGVFWVDVSNVSSAFDGFLRIARLLGSPADNVDDVRLLLANTKHDWLLVLDNADDIHMDYSEYFPTGTRGTVLLTSRLPKLGRFGTVGWEELDNMDQDDCLDLLFLAAGVSTRSRDKHMSAAKRVIDLVGSHTLALIQAGAYIAAFCSFEEYHHTFNKQRERMLKLSVGQEQSRYKNAFATFEASAQVLTESDKDSHQDAMELLQILANLHHDHVPFELFTDAAKGANLLEERPKNARRVNLSKWHSSRLPQCLQGLSLWTPSRVTAAQHVLQSLALVRIESEGSSSRISMHPLVHTWAGLRRDQAQRYESWQAAGCIFALAYFNEDEWEVRFDVRPHVQTFIHAASSEDSMFESIEMTHALIQCCKLMHELSMDSVVFDLLPGLFDKLGADLAEPTEELERLYQLAASILAKYGEAPKAIGILEKIKTQKVKVLAEEDQKWLTLNRLLAAAYSSDGQTEKCIRILERILEIRAATLAQDDRRHLASMISLADAYLRDRQIERGMKLLEKAIKIQNESQSGSELLRQHAQLQLGSAYLEDGQFEKGAAILEQVLQVWEIRLAKDDRSLVHLQLELGRAYEMMGQKKKSVKFLERILDEQMALPNADPRKLNSQFVLANSYIQEGQVTRGIELLRQVIEEDSKHLSEAHPVLLDVKCGLARAYHKDGQVSRAIALFEYIVELSKATIPKDHPHQLLLKSCLALAYRTDGQVQLAMNLWEYIMDVETLSERSMFRREVQFELAKTYLRNGQPKKAEDLLKRTMKIVGTTMAADHPFRLDVEDELKYAKRTNRDPRNVARNTFAKLATRTGVRSSRPHVPEVSVWLSRRFGEMNQRLLQQAERRRTISGRPHKQITAADSKS